MKVSNWTSPAMAGFLKLGISRSCVSGCSSTPRKRELEVRRVQCKISTLRFETLDRRSVSHLRSRCSTDVDIRWRDRDVNYSIRLSRLVEESFLDHTWWKAG